MGLSIKISKGTSVRVGYHQVMAEMMVSTAFSSVEPATGVWCLASGLAVNTSVWARVATSLSLTVLAPNTHPNSGHAGGMTINMFCEHYCRQWGVVS